MRIALAQINPTVGDVDGNADRIIRHARQAREQRADLVVFPELCVTGYPPLDLLENSGFMADTRRAVDRIVREVPSDMGIVLGCPVPNEGRVGKRLHNAALLFENGREVGRAIKALLPTYDVFDEYRHFEPGTERSVVVFRGLRLGLHVCEDMWNNEEQAPYHLYAANPIDELAALGIDLFVNISASPFSLGKVPLRDREVEDICAEHGIPFVLVNTVGANTDVLFDGSSSVHDSGGRVLRRAPSFREALVVWDTDADRIDEPVGREDIDDLHDALVMGIHDYVVKTGRFDSALVGLSGGIDSAVTCALAVEALGPERVVGITMPSAFSSAGSVDDSRALANALGIRLHEIGIEPAVDAFDSMLGFLFDGTEFGIAEENIQARVRGTTLMAVSNKFGYLLLSTGNKSEHSVGYATLYGDMNGGLAVLADVFKTQVYELARHINRRSDRTLIPESTLTKPPSAELRPDQKDSDSLPEYEVLDDILVRYIECQEDIQEIVGATGHSADFVRRILDMVDRSEYKRRQSAPGLRVSPKAFGMGRRVPIVNGWRRGVPSEEKQSTP